MWLVVSVKNLLQIELMFDEILRSVSMMSEQRWMHNMSRQEAAREALRLLLRVGGRHEVDSTYLCITM